MTAVMVAVAVTNSNNNNTTKLTKGTELLQQQKYKHIYFPYHTHICT